MSQLKAETNEAHGKVDRECMTRQMNYRKWWQVLAKRREQNVLGRVCRRDDWTWPFHFGKAIDKQ